MLTPLGRRVAIELVLLSATTFPMLGVGLALVPMDASMVGVYTTILGTFFVSGTVWGFDAWRRRAIPILQTTPSRFPLRRESITVIQAAWMFAAAQMLMQTLRFLGAVTPTAQYRLLWDVMGLVTGAIFLVTSLTWVYDTWKRRQVF